MARWTAADIPDQQGRTVLVTGANSGLGLRSAEALAAAGARVLLGCRNAEKAAVACDAVAARATGPAPEVVALDLADLDSVALAAAAVTAQVDHLDVLMNNAGVMALPMRRTPQGHELQFGTNHLGHFALTGRLLPCLLAAPSPRVVTTSSQMHRLGKIRWDDPDWRRGRYARWGAYSQSKLANLLFTAELARLAAAAGSTLLAAAAHPGYASTHLQAAGPQMSGNKVVERVMGVTNRVFGQSDEMGALPQLYAATMPDVVPGDYWGPNGRFQSSGYPTRVDRSKAASDGDASRRLWRVSEELTGVTYQWDSAC